MLPQTEMFAIEENGLSGVATMSGQNIGLVDKGETALCAITCIFVSFANMSYLIGDDHA